MLYEPVNLRQTETGAASDLLGREKRFENPVDLVRRNAAAGIDDRHRDEISRRDFRRSWGSSRRAREADGQRSMAFHGIARIGHQVDHDRFELVDVGLDRQRPFRNFQHKCNAGPEHRLKHIGDALQLPGDVEDFPIHRMTT